MRFGLDIPNSGEYFQPRLLAELAHEAEGSGWDGVFIWDHMSHNPLADQTHDQTSGGSGKIVPTVDPWVALSAVAMRTERIRIGTMVTPVARRRPWKLARETVSLDHLSNGRLTLGVGLGDPRDEEFEDFGEDGEPRLRAGKLDEGLQVLTGLWSEKPLSFVGEHYRIREKQFLPGPVQSPRIPIWVGGMWPRKAPFRRAARWDGVYPIRKEGGYLSPDDIRALVAYISSQRTSDAPFDVATAGNIPIDDHAKVAEMVAEYAEAGATWWVQGVGRNFGSLEEVRTRIHVGPPKL